MSTILRTTILLLALALGLTLACFQPPDDDVLFSCDPLADDRCPAGYTCEADGCCHRDGTDVQASFGACGLGGNETGTASETGSGTESDTGTESGTDTGTTSETDTSGTDTSGTDTSGTDTGTTDTTSG
ncbi:hypothetical protein ACNOYE_00295 [Nannocystaceae bacterium ST9]